MPSIPSKKTWHSQKFFSQSRCTLGHVEASNTRVNQPSPLAQGQGAAKENKATDNTKAQTFSTDTESNSTV